MSRRLRDPESAGAVFLLTALAFIALALIGGVFLGRATKNSTTVDRLCLDDTGVDADGRPEGRRRRTQARQLRLRAVSRTRRPRWGLLT